MVLTKGRIIWISSLSDSGLDYLYPGLQLQTNLTKLELEFEACSHLSDKGFKNLSDTIAQLPKLSELKLNLSGCLQLSKTNLQDLADALVAIPHLKKLDFALATRKSTNEGIISPLPQTQSKVVVNLSRFWHQYE